MAEVQGTPVTVADFRHWMAIAYNELGALPRREPVPQPPLYASCVASARAHLLTHQPVRSLRARCAHNYALARSDAISFLVRAQWLLKDGHAHNVHISSAALARAVARAIRQQYGGPTQFAKFLTKTGMTRADFRFNVRINTIADALQARATPAPRVTAARVASYYRAHRTNYSVPPRRLTLVVVTRSHAAALRAKAALSSGQPWARVAKRYSEDSSKLVGGAYAVVPGIQPTKLVHAVFSAPRGALEGPVATPLPRVTGGGSLYYLFKVTGARAGSQQPLAKVAAQIRHTLIQARQQRVISSLVTAFATRWRTRTRCQPGYVIKAVCGNGGGKSPKQGI